MIFRGFCAGEFERVEVLFLKIERAEAGQTG
jgi:hypothetical protein